MTHRFKNFRLLSLMTTAALGLCAAGCVQTPSVLAGADVAQTYVLVHGAFEDKSAWDDVRRGLEQAGQSVIAIDLPGRSGDATLIDQVGGAPNLQIIGDVANGLEGRLVGPTSVALGDGLTGLIQLSFTCARSLTTTKTSRTLSTLTLRS